MFGNNLYNIYDTRCRLTDYIFECSVVKPYNIKQEFFSVFEKKKGFNFKCLA